MQTLTSPAENPTRIAFCITDLDPGGAERILVQLVTRLDRTRWQPCVFCLSGRGKLVGDLEQAGIPVSCLGAKHWWQIWIVVQLAIQLRRFQPEVLQTFLFHANILGRIAGWLAGIQQIVSGIRVAEKRNRLPLLIDRWTNRLVVRNVCVSRAVATFSEQQGALQPEKTCVIPNGVDVQKYCDATPADLSKFGIPHESRTIISVGRLDHQKNPLLLLQAVENLTPKYDDLQVLLVGDGPQADDLERWITERQLQDRIHLAGWRADIPELLKASYGLALTSRWEGMPNVVLEAMAAGLPVVATHVEGTEELICPIKNGFLVEPESVEELHSALDRLLSSPSAAKKMGMESQGIVLKHFTIDKMVTSFETLYSSLLGS